MQIHLDRETLALLKKVLVETEGMLPTRPERRRSGSNWHLESLPRPAMGSEIQDDCDLPRYAELIDAWRRSKPLGSIEPSVSWVALARAGFRQAPAPFEKRPPSVGVPYFILPSTS